MFSSDDLSPRPAGSAVDNAEALYAALETAWQRGDHPTLEDFLPPDEPARGDAIKLLAPMDFEYRFALNPDVRIEDYLQRFPQLDEDLKFLGEFVAWEAELRRGAKQVIDVGEYASRFPQVAASDLPTGLQATSADVPAPRVEDRPAEPSAVPPREEEAEMPARIGRYQIVRRLGQGGFGCVYLAHDIQLNRDVAIKAPLRRLDRDRSTVERFLKEAQLVAGLDHHAIVPIYDFGTIEEQRYFVVSKYISGSNLSERLRSRQLPFEQSAALIATVADALQYAHERKICHRDVKPANILLDETGRVFLTDFGLALTVDGLGSHDRMAGTPIYMSPEQAAGEAHRVDGRSDIFSLGAVFYELLCGERHTVGTSVKEVLYKIQFVDTRPPRQLNRQIPAELERICLRALARRPAERYTAAGDMADDLRTFLGSDGTSPRTKSSPERVLDADPSRRIVPKGLRSFDEKDHEFFLQLLPGPRDRDGLPNKIRFWKDHIEEQDASLTFCIGLLYGPSGCGKSSLVKAGLLPLLSNRVITLYVEATADDTETCLKKVLDRQFSNMSGMATLKERLAAIRRQQVPLGGRKLLIVLDQFEQWLHSQPIEETTDLIQALRECDGSQLQCVLMVRDDFWMPVTRFFQKLDIPLRENDNSAAVDLFDLAHASKVLRLFGIAYHRLPDGDLSQIDAQFLNDAVDGIAQSGWIMCVRLALFAEMMRGRPWNAESLAQIGGATGVGLAFLEETFSGRTAPPSHRMHQKAARHVLKALLPESGSSIRGRACNEVELRQASGYQAHTNDFAELMYILDSEVRLITPAVADENGDSDENAPTSPSASARRHYQLTHDYLVAPLRDWLTRKQKETRRGRAQLLLEERATAWKAIPQRRHLPSWWESLRIALFTRRRTWNESERKMMRSAGWFHGVNTAFLFATTVLILAFGVHTVLDQRENRKQEELRKLEALIEEQRRKLVADLTGADWTGLPLVIDALGKDAQAVKPLLKQEFLAASPGNPRKLPIALALLELSQDRAEQEEYVDYAFEELLQAEPEPFALLQKALTPSSSRLTDKLWNVFDDAHGDPTHQPLQAAVALAKYDPRNPRWSQIAPEVTGRLLELGPLRIGPWHAELQPVAEQLAPSLTRLALDPKQSTARSMLMGFVKNGPPSVRQAAMRELQGAVDLSSAEGRAPKANNTVPTLSADVRNILERADGRITEDFAFCHGLTIDEFNGVRAELTAGQYRPVSVRPYSSGEVTKLAVVWTRDARAWDWKHGTASEIQKTNQDLIARGYAPHDVSGWVSPAAAAEIQYAAVWVETDESARTLYVGLPEATFPWPIGTPFDARTAPSLLCFSQVPEGESRYTFSAVESSGPARPSVVESLSGQEYTGSRYPGLLQVDVQLGHGSGSRHLAEHILDQRKTLPKGADDDDADTLRWAKAVYYTSRFSVAENVEDLDTAAGYLFVILHRRQLPIERLQQIAKWHVLLLATLGRRDGCEAGLKRLPDYRTAKTEQAFVHAMSTCLLDPHNLDAIRESVRQQLEPAFPDMRALYAAARVLAVAGEFARRRSDPQADACLAEAVGFLQQACTAEFAKPSELAKEMDFEPLRDRPDFKAFAAEQNIDKEFAAVWQASSQLESLEAHGLTIADHLAWCQQRMNEGCFPVRIAVLDQGDGGTTAASVWHRPLVPREQQLLRARRQAAQAAVQFQLENPETLRKGLAFTSDPTLRSYFVTLLKEFGTEGKQLVNLLSQETDRSVQSGLVLALGKYRPTDWDHETQRILDTTLERLYGTQDDHALRASIQWLLRTWKRPEELAQWDERFHGDNAQRKAAGSWYVTDELQGPTLIPIQGGSFIMGSPGWETGRSDGELPHQATIPRDFRMSATPVTRGQFLRFLRDDQRMDNQELRERLLQRYESLEFRKLCPEDNCPMVGVTWYLAAEYCNWLSAKEQLEPCYVAESELGAFGPGMSPATNFIARNGFRLPTEAEWEYACRAGTTTVRYFGNDTELLPDYAWFAINAGERTHPVGTRIPNGFGLFDMLGNAFTWCGDRYLPYTPTASDLGDDSEVNPNQQRIVRGGAFAHDATRVRTAFRGAVYADETALGFVGFRIVQTIPAPQ